MDDDPVLDGFHATEEDEEQVRHRLHTGNQVALIAAIVFATRRKNFRWR